MLAISELIDYSITYVLLVKLGTTQENRASKIDNIFQRLVGVDALFEFRSNNNEINNPNTFLIVRRKTKKERTSKESVELGQTIGLSAQVTTTEDMACISSKDHLLDADIKGKKVATTVSDSTNCFNK